LTLAVLATYGPTELRWLKEGIDILYVTKDRIRRYFYMMPMLGIFRIHPRKLWELPPEEMALRFVQAAVYTRFWRSGFDELGPHRRRLADISIAYAIAFARRLPSLPPEALKPYLERENTPQASPRLDPPSHATGAG
jgi:hypothetical protein